MVHADINFNRLDQKTES